MMDDKEVIKERLSFFPKLYDLIQIFGPMSEEELLEKKGTCLLDEECVKKNSCENCVAIRSLAENKAFSMYDEHEGKIINMTATPVMEGGKKYVVELFREMSEEDLQYAGILQKDSLKQIERLNYELMHDPLTGAYNRRYLEEKIVFAVLDAIRKKEKFAIVMADIDFFKKVNDKYGHQAGDSVLRTVAATIQNVLTSNNGVLIRYGGEEFLMCIPEREVGSTYEIIEKLRKEIEQISICFEEQKINVTASFGIVSVEKMIETEESCTNKLIQIADSNLYQAKCKGRNIIVASVYTDELCVEGR